jgi:predicted  nucleic acid-binding Zn-ribbon protein
MTDVTNADSTDPELAYLRIELEAAREHLRRRDEFLDDIDSQVLAMQQRMEEFEAHADQLRRDSARVDRLRRAVRRVPGAYPLLRWVRRTGRKTKHS